MPRMNAITYFGIVNLFGQKRERKERARGGGRGSMEVVEEYTFVPNHECYVWSTHCIIKTGGMSTHTGHRKTKEKGREGGRNGEEE